MLLEVVVGVKLALDLPIAQRRDQNCVLVCETSGLVKRRILYKTLICLTSYEELISRFH
jgi:hypothetical protein